MNDNDPNMEREKPNKVDKIDFESKQDIGSISAGKRRLIDNEERVMPTEK